MAGPQEIEALRDALWRRAKAAWPEIAIDRSVFLAYVEERVAGASDPAAALAALHVEDLYLACACAHGDEAALRVLERDYVAQVASYLARPDALASFTDEVKQAVRHRLLVAPRDALPKIASNAL